MILPRAKILTPMAEGLLCRIYHCIRLLNVDKPHFLISPELQKLRVKVERQFPDIPDMSKVFATVVTIYLSFITDDCSFAQTSGYDIFTEEASSIILVLADFDALILDMIEFPKTVIAVLQEFSNEMLDSKVC